MAFDNKALSPENVAQIAGELDVSERDVNDMNMRLTYSDESLNNPLYSADQEESGELIDMIPEESESQEVMIAEHEDAQRKRALMVKAIDQLNERERFIIEVRRLSERPKTLEELSSHFDISRERVRQIEASAIAKMQKFAEANA